MGKPKTFKDPLSPAAWYTHSWAPMFQDRYNMPAGFGAKEIGVVKKLFRTMGGIYPNSTPEFLYEETTHLARIFLDREAFDWITLRDLFAFNGNIYRVKIVAEEESDHEENDILDTLYGIEERILQKTPSQIEGVEEVLALARSIELQDGDGEPI